MSHGGSENGTGISLKEGMLAEVDELSTAVKQRGKSTEAHH